MKKLFYIKIISVLPLFVFLFSNHAISQEFDMSKYRPIYKFNMNKQADNSRLLEVEFMVRNKKVRKDRIPVLEAEIDFVNVFENNEVLLGRVMTSEKGIATLELDENQKYLIDDEGYINLEARFKGSEVLPKKTARIQVKDIQLVMSLKEIDSIKTVVISAYELDSIGNKLFVDELDVKIAVGSMLSKMTIEDVTLNNGTYSYEFPTDLPGDKNRNLEVFTSIEDHDDFGNVTQKNEVNWGVYQENKFADKNKLWTSAAPIWMYIVLTIMLVGVWANYIYTIFHLYKLKKEGDQLDLEYE